MEKTVKNRLKTGFTAARWGLDFCLGALFLATAFIVSALMKKQVDLTKTLMIPLAMCIFGLAVFAAGRVIVGLQSRKLNLHMDRPLAEEERWFVGCMLEMEKTGAGVSFYNSAARVTSGSVDNIAAGAAAAAVTGRFFKIGKKYMGHSFIFNRLPAIVSLAAAIAVVVFAVL